jgi:hypothetical protein
MVKMVELLVTDADGRVLNRVAVNEDLFNYVLGETKKDRTDLTTAWFLRIMRAIFEPTTIYGSTQAAFVDISGSSTGQYFKYNTGSGAPGGFIFWNTNNCNNRLLVYYGNSSAPPTRSDYKLGNKLGEAVAGVAVDETQGVLTISASFTMAVDTVIYEVGLAWEATIGGATTCKTVLLDRTVIQSGITVAAGQTLTVVYRFIFP